MMTNDALILRTLYETMNMKMINDQRTRRRGAIQEDDTTDIATMMIARITPNMMWKSRRRRSIIDIYGSHDVTNYDTLDLGLALEHFGREETVSGYENDFMIKLSGYCVA